jgi:hypothetical protein
MTSSNSKKLGSVKALKTLETKRSPVLFMLLTFIHFIEAYQMRESLGSFNLKLY